MTVIPSDSPRLVLSGPRSQIWVAKAFCERVGLRVVPHSRKRPVGFAAYYIEVPDDYPKDRAARVARQMKHLVRILRLSHVRRRLLVRAGGAVSPWKIGLAQRDPPPWLRR